MSDNDKIITAGAAAIANTRGGRRGMPPITNILDVLPAKLRDEVTEDMKAVVEAIDAAGYRIERKLPEQVRKAMAGELGTHAAKEGA